MRVINETLNELSHNLKELDKKNNPVLFAAREKEFKEAYWKLKNDELKKMGCITQDFVPSSN